MNFLRHVGKIGDRKVAIVFREVPNEDHMALVVYTESLNRHIHDPLMKCIESDIGQNSENLADALNRTHTNDGKIILQVLHKEGLLKKVQTNQVVMTPNPSAQIKLDELNKILDEMKQGEEATQRLAEMDQSLGLQSKKEVANRMRNKDKSTPATNVPDAPGVLGDTALANNLRQQAQRMAAEAKGLLAESDRLLKEAAEMDGTAKVSTTTLETTTAKKRGRPAKATAIV